MAETTAPKKARKVSTSPRGRKPKIHVWLVYMRKFWESLDLTKPEDLAYCALLDYEIVDVINDSIPKGKREKYSISESTFRNYKEGRTVTKAEDKNAIKEFITLHKKFEDACKRKFKGMMIRDPFGETRSWQRFGWILQRKWPNEFADYQKRSVEHSGPNGGAIQVESVSFKDAAPDIPQSAQSKIQSLD